MKRLCAALVVVCLAAGLVLAAAARPVPIQSTAQHRIIGRLLVDQVMIIRHWEVFEAHSELQDQIRGIIGDMQSQDYEYLTIELPGKPIGAGSPRQSLDEFEQELLGRFSRSTVESGKSNRAAYAERLTEDGKAYQYYQPITVKRSCVSVCHAASSPAGVAGLTKPFAEGQPMAVMRITIPVQPEP